MTRKMTFSAFVGLAVTLFYCFQQSTAGGTLNFLTLYSYFTVYGDDGYSSPIATQGFNFGTSTVYSVYVSSNGYISMGVSPSGNPNSPTIPYTTSIVAPYAADIDPLIAGTVKYTHFTSSFQMSTVSSFIRSQIGNSFYGTRMMVAEWSNVAKGSSFSTSSFQCVLITDGSSSYAVFIYECGDIEWSGATIGWAYSNSNYAKHLLSGSNSQLIGCEYSTGHSAIVYRLDGTPCDSDKYTCGNGHCVRQSYICDGDNDCGDNSDEDDCTCDSDEFACDNGGCVPQSYVCDGDNDCGDDSDEQGCSCDSDEFTCDNGNCVPQSDTCDGDDNCGDDSDEQGCCDSDEFTCDNGECEPDYYECDGDDDCGDNSDEEGCYSVNVKLAVGLSVGVFSVIVFIGIPIAICGFIYCAVNRRRHTVVTRVVSTTPSAGTEPLLSSQECAVVTDYPQQQSTPYPSQDELAKQGYPPATQVYQPPT